MQTLRKEDLTRIGFVNKTSGFKGNVNCILEISQSAKILKYNFLFLILEGLPVPFAVEEMEINGNEMIVKFEDVDSEMQAKRITRKEIYVEKRKEKKKKEILSWKDLIGYSVIDENEGEAGEIYDVLEYPMQYIASCRMKEKEFMFPLNDDLILEIDDEEKIIYVDLPPGLLDVYLDN